MTSESFVWTCSSCGRQVPRRVDTCRCGSARPADAPVERVLPEPAVSSVGRASSSSPGEPDRVRPTNEGASAAHGPVRLLLGVLLGIGLAAALWFQFVAPSTEREPRVAAPIAAVTDPTDEANTAAADSTELAGATTASALDAAVTPLTAPVVPGPSLASLEETVATSLPAVASIQAGQARGTGFFVRPNLVITNAHVVEGQTSVQLQAGGTRYTARVATISPSTDLAILNVDHPSLQQPTLRLGSLDDVRVGEEVVAIGSAFGVLSNTVTRG